MRPLPQTICGVALSLALVAVLLAARPLVAANVLLDRFFSGERSGEVAALADPETQETSRGDGPAGPFARAAEVWASHPERSRVVLLGNSQMMSVSLAEGEARTGDPEPTYSDLLAAELGATDPPVQVYRVAAQGLSYAEAWWYTAFLASDPRLTPRALLVQLNYQSFWNGGVRDGLLELLERGAFRRAVEAQQARSDFADADTLRRAVASFDARRAAVAPQRASGTIAASTAGPPTLVATAEAAARGWLDSVDGFKTRALQQQEVFDLFYRLRVYVLRIRPTTARTITGARLVRSRAALEAMLEQCRAAGIRAILFDAPVNPRVSLYRRPEDRASYDAFKRHLATTYGVPVHDLSGIVPADAWGTWMGEPDPLHLGRRGHRLVAAAMREMLRAEGVVPD